MSGYELFEHPLYICHLLQYADLLNLDFETQPFVFWQAMWQEAQLLQTERTAMISNSSWRSSNGIYFVSNREYQSAAWRFQGHPRSLIMSPIESLYALLY